LSDFAKEDRMELLHYCFRALDDFVSEYHRVPTSGCKDDYALFMEKLSRYSKGLYEREINFEFADDKTL